MPRAIPSQPWLRHLARHVPLARAGEDPEGVHQVRIAAGRLDVWLRMRSLRVLRDDLRWLRKAAAQVRDLDVLLERRLPDGFQAWTRDERLRAHAALAGVLEAPRTTALVAALASLPPVGRTAARDYAAGELRELQRRGRRITRDDATSADMHAVRRSLRRIRYAREWLGLKTASLKALQDELGSLNDSAVALAHLDRSPHAQLLAEWRSELESDVRKRLELARAAWRGAKLAPRRSAH